MAIVCAVACRPEALVSFTTMATEDFWGMINHDIRIVEAALKTIVLCAGEELRRGLAGQRLLSVDRPSTAAVSTSARLIHTHAHTLSQFDVCY